jgi:hypothetical protein
MTVTTAYHAPHPLVLDFALLRNVFRYFAVVITLLAPATRDPLLVMACGAAPWVLLTLVDRPGMPAIIVYYLLFMWLQAAARVLVACLDGEALGDGVYGQDLYRAFWYSIASLIVLGLVLRVCLSRLPPPPPSEYGVDRHWRPAALFFLYLAALALAILLTALMPATGGMLSQPLQALASLKYVIMFMLFTSVLTTGRGVQLVISVLLIETIVGLTELFSGFKVVFIVLLAAALSVQLRLRVRNLLGGVAIILLLTGLGLFWTAVKQQYRGVATGFSGTQGISASFGERTEWLLGRAMRLGEIDWGTAADSMIRRIGYIDFFGAVIGIAETAPDPVNLGRWRETLEHITTPRALFPDKAVLNDNILFATYVRRGAVSDETRGSTSISVGFLAENFIDFGFPRMLMPVALMGVALGGVLRYFMSRPVAWPVREGFVAAVVLDGIAPGMELSLAKYFGTIIIHFVVLALVLKFIYPALGRWLELASGRGGHLDGTAAPLKPGTPRR